MNIAVLPQQGQPAGVRVLGTPVDFERFRDAACAAAIWERSLPPDVTEWLAGLNPDQLPSGRIVLHVRDVKGALGALCDAAGMPPGSQRAWLMNDIIELAQHFASLMQTEHVRLRLEAVTTNACRKFHLDAIIGRLVCTYRGTGTQYGLSSNGADPETIYTVPTSAPILLRGSLWPPTPAPGLLHRSPPIEGTGETRLVLVLDPIYDLDDAE